ncbi:hypothetical protein IAU60_002864 [Kwoniella sp. DSM 27419]
MSSPPLDPSPPADGAQDPPSASTPTRQGDETSQQRAEGASDQDQDFASITIEFTIPAPTPAAEDQPASVGADQPSTNPVSDAEAPAAPGSSSGSSSQEEPPAPRPDRDAPLSAGNILALLSGDEPFGANSALSRIGPMGGDGNNGGSIFWTIRLRPDGLPSVGINPSGQESTPGAEGANGEPNNPARPNQPPPWLFPPFFNFFMPIRSEPRPDPEKAAELLRSLPTVDRSLLMRVDRIVAAQEMDTDMAEEDKGWKCGICLEGIDREETQRADKGEMVSSGQGSADTVADRQVGADAPAAALEGQPASASDAEPASSAMSTEATSTPTLEEEGTGVKSLPCNHLYHGKCLEPWFASKHTCPSCRLDLDPLQTLNTPADAPGSTLRPGATSNSRSRSPHPYARPDTPAGAGPVLGGSTPQAADASGEAPHRHFHPGPPGEAAGSGTSGDDNNRNDDGPHITFFWSAPAGGPGLPSGFNPFLPFPAHGSGPRQESISPMTSAPAPTNAAAQAEDTVQTGGEQSRATTQETSSTESGVGLTAPQASGRIFDAPTFTSPLAMGQRTSSAPFLPPLPVPHFHFGHANRAASPGRPDGPADSADPVTSEGINDENASMPAIRSLLDDGRPLPQRRPHITVIRTGSPGPGPALGVPGAGPGLPFPFPSTLLHRPVSPSPAGNAATEAATEVEAPAAQVAGALPDAPDGPTVPASANAPETDAPSAAPVATPRPFVAQSLESWTQEREKSLGWRCDASECVHAAALSVDGGETTLNSEEQVDAGKEMLDLYAALTPDAVPESEERSPKRQRLGTTSPGLDKEKPLVEVEPLVKYGKLGLLACPHRYHRTCIEQSERAAGRSGRQEMDKAGRVWVRCERCRKDGWVVGRREGLEGVDEEGAPSEKEVERLIAESAE